MVAEFDVGVAAARALVSVIPDSRWHAVGIAHAAVALSGGSSIDEAAVLMRDRGVASLKASKQILNLYGSSGFYSLLAERASKGGAADPVPKLFPGRITEEFFREDLKELECQVQGLTFSDHRATEHSLIDFTVHQNGSALPVNVKVASTKFKLAKALVGLEPDDCLPIPAYKAHGAVEREPNLVYAVSADFELLDQIKTHLPPLLTKDETIVWSLLQNYAGPLVSHAEDLFVFAITEKHWQALKDVIRKPVFHIISARRAIRILNTKPKRTPGIGMRGWGTGATAEVNVHVSIAEDTALWENVKERIIMGGVNAVLDAINRTKTEATNDPEI